MHAARGGETIFTPYGLGERSASSVHLFTSFEGRGRVFSQET